MRKGKRRIGRVLLAIMLVGALWAGWGLLKPLLGAGEAVAYESRTVERGDIETAMSFAATISARYVQTIAAGSRTSVDEVYVAAGDRVASGDKLVRLKDGTLYKAEIDGTVEEAPVSAGEAVWPNSTLIQIGDFDRLQATLRVDEYDIMRLAIGQKCTVAVVPLGLTFETEIARINRVSASSGSVAYYTVVAEIGAPESVLPGMQATVTIPQDGAEDVPLLWMDALAFDGGAPYVLVRNAEGKYQRLDVKVGLHDGLRAEITEGLSAGDIVYFASGTETAKSLFSLTNIYKALFGEKIVVNDRTQTGGGRFSGGSMSLPEGMEQPEGMQFPAGMELPGRQEGTQG